MKRIVNLLFLVVFTTTFISCNTLDVPTGADGPKKQELDGLIQLVGQPREEVVINLGYPRKHFTLDDRQFMLYIDGVSRYSQRFIAIGFIPLFPTFDKVWEGTKARCLKIEIDSENLVKNFKFKYTGLGTDSSNSDFRCEYVFFGESELKYIAPESWLVESSFQPGSWLVNPVPEPDSDCEISQAAQDAIDRAFGLEKKSLAALELLDEAVTAAMPPECDSVRAKILADWAYEMIMESDQ